MGHYTKQQAIAVVTACAKAYQKNLEGQTLLFVCMDKHQRTSCFEFTFDANNFLHLTGLKPALTDHADGTKHRLGAREFYERCLDGRLRVQEFDFAADGTTPLKLDVLPFVMTQNLSASMIGDYNSNNPRLYTQKLVGGVKACVGFVVSASSGCYVPNTVLKVDIRDYTANTVRVVAVFRKKKQETRYSELTYRAKKVDLALIQFPEEYTYLSNTD